MYRLLMYYWMDMQVTGDFQVWLREVDYILATSPSGRRTDTVPGIELNQAFKDGISAEDFARLVERGAIPTHTTPPVVFSTRPIAPPAPSVWMGVLAYWALTVAGCVLGLLAVGQLIAGLVTLSQMPSPLPPVQGAGYVGVFVSFAAIEGLAGLLIGVAQILAISMRSHRDSQRL